MSRLILALSTIWLASCAEEQSSESQALPAWILSSLCGGIEGYSIWAEERGSNRLQLSTQWSDGTIVVRFIPIDSALVSVDVWKRYHSQVEGGLHYLELGSGSFSFGSSSLVGGLHNGGFATLRVVSDPQTSKEEQTMQQIYPPSIVCHFGGDGRRMESIVLKNWAAVDSQILLTRVIKSVASITAANDCVKSSDLFPLRENYESVAIELLGVPNWIEKRTSSLNYSDGLIVESVDKQYVLVWYKSLCNELTPDAFGREIRITYRNTEGDKIATDLRVH